jgi:hypothetical protein
MLREYYTTKPRALFAVVGDQRGDHVTSYAVESSYNKSKFRERGLVMSFKPLEVSWNEYWVDFGEIVRVVDL